MKMSIPILAGIVGSDGHLDRKQKVIRIINSDRNFINLVASFLKEVTGKKPNIHKSVSGFGKTRLTITVTSPRLWKLLQEKFKIPIGAKSGSINPPKNLDLKESLEFLSGWIAGDGSITTDRKRVKIEIWSKSINMLKWFSLILKQVGVSSRIWSASRNRFILRIGKKDDICRFHKIIKIPHPRKENKLNHLLKCS